MLTTDEHKASRGLSATAELLVSVWFRTLDYAGFLPFGFDRTVKARL